MSESLEPIKTRISLAESLQLHTYDVTPARHMSYVVAFSQLPLTLAAPTPINISATLFNFAIAGTHLCNQVKWENRDKVRTNVKLAKQANDLMIVSAVGSGLFVHFASKSSTIQPPAHNLKEVHAAIEYDEVGAGLALLAGCYAALRRPLLKRMKASLTLSPLH